MSLSLKAIIVTTTDNRKRQIICDYIKTGSVYISAIIEIPTAGLRFLKNVRVSRQMRRRLPEVIVGL